MKKTLISLLLISTVCATPALANYFSNPRTGINLNIGSAPNPKPAPVFQETVYDPVPSSVYISAPVVEPAAAPLVEAEAPIVRLVDVVPPPPPAVRKYVIFFDFDKSQLTAEAKEVVAAAVRTAKETGMVRVVVTGHTDTVGSPGYNQALSERRAAATKMEMTRLGLDATGIATVGRSFSEPLVATGPGVREPQNRRAVIDLGYNLTAELVPGTE